MANPVLTTDLSGRGFLTALEASSAKDLASLLMQIKIPMRIRSIYSDGKRHFAIVETNRKLTIKEK